MKSFLDACRLMEPLQIVVEAADEPDVGVRVLHQPFALIGRDPRADVPLEHRLVSRRHVYLQVVEGQPFWIDLESRLGTLGGGRPRKYGWLTREEPIRIGPYELRLPASSRIGDRPPEVIPLVSRSYGAAAWPEVGLEFLNGPSRSAVWPMNRVVSLVGSAAGCKFRLADPSVSLFHCSLVRTQVGLWVVDLLGGGVEVNNAAVRYALLADGDVLGVGRYRIRIQCKESNVEDSSPERRWSPPVRTGIVGVGRDLALSQPASSRSSTDLAMSLRPRDAGAAPIVPVVPSMTVLPAELDAANLGESAAVLVPLMNQFGVIQQQMMDQFQNAIGMLVEMFGSLQREQMDLIRQELDQLREVTREVQDLKAELAAYGRERSAERATEPTPPPTPEPTKRPAAPVPPRTSVGASRAPSGEAVSPRPATASKANEAAAASPAAAADEAGAKAPLGPGPARPSTRQRAEKAPRPGPEAGDGDVMFWLNNRIASLQEERESRWQKILKLLPGSS